MTSTFVCRRSGKRTWVKTKETHLLLIIVFPLFELVPPFWHPSSVRVMRGQLVAEIGLPLEVLPPEAVCKGKVRIHDYRG